MGLLKKFFKRAPRKERVLVVGLDGLGLEFGLELARAGIMPNLGELLAQGDALELQPVLPTVSAVAWATYACGSNPGRHGVFGFVDRQPNPFAVKLPDARDLKQLTLWEVAGRAGKQVGVMNLPMTYPPKSVNGFLVSGFGAPELAKATYPVELAPRLMEMDYRIDVDTRLAMNDTAAFLQDLAETLGRRFSVAFQLMNSEPWDFFHLHVMGPDRINHFLWGELDAEGGLGQEFAGFYRQLDAYLGELSEVAGPETSLLLVSDHGFTACRAHLYVNHWLEKNGYLLFGRGKRELMNMHADSRAYSLVPGRIYVNLKGREERGSVERGKPYEELREELIHRLGGLTHPDTGEPLVLGVHRREDLYEGGQVSRAADLIVDPAPGFDLKANLDGPGLLGPPALPGMHAASGAFCLVPGVEAGMLDGPPGLADLSPTVLNLLGVAVPTSMEGRSLV